MKNYSYDNHIFDKNIINDLIYTSKSNTKNKDDFYFLINISTYKRYKSINKIQNIYDISIPETKYSDIVIPKLYIYKIIIIKINNNISFISNTDISSNNIYNLYEYLTNNITNDLNIIINLLLNISKSKSYNYIIYKNIKILDNMSSHILYFEDYINTLIICLDYINNKNNEKNINIINKLNNIKKKINSTKFYYDSLKTTSLQKITHHETNISKVLTYVATIFLPLSFLISIFSLPIKNIPLRDSENSFYYILFIILIVTIISSIYLIQMDKKNVFTKN